ncbi:AGAP002724-PA-like protein [Anopheles sinensis]|uniref:AGAP002724-PA-like protein n=1 Tax=Anopheles sinensis TaxID=74873 RepID=A0A084VRJ0_ANOSI|nr:AGAP002724-PA-like protein [Anopheles sinensis]
MLCSVLVIPLTIQQQTREDEDSSCTQIDFDEETLTSLRKCGFVQQFTAKPYDESTKFDPYRPGTNFYLSNQWQGLTCGETVRTYAFNSDTELRMAYNAVFESGATLEVRVYDLDRVDSTGKAILVESWRTTTSTEGWGFFREKLNKTVNQAQIQIEANMNAGSDLAIEYLTIFNYEVETEECSAIDEFLTTTEIPTTTTEGPTTTFPATTTAAPITSSTMLSTETEEITIPTTGQTSTTVHSADSSSQSTSTLTPPTVPGSITPSGVDLVSSNQWMWMTLAAMFGTLLLLATSVVLYLWYANQHLDRVMMSLLDELSYETTKHKEKPLTSI